LVSADSDLSVSQMAERVATLVAGFERVSTPRQARESAEALVSTIVGLYGNGIERILEIVHETAGHRSPEIFERLAADSFVESLLCLHGLHPVALEDRVQAALDSVRPYLESHEGGVEIAGIEDGVVLLRLEGSCDGCPSSAATVKLAVEKAILERVPEIHEVRAIGVAGGAGASDGFGGSGGIDAPGGIGAAGDIGLADVAPATNGRTSLKLESDWIAVDELPGLAADPDAGIAARDVGGSAVLFVRFGKTIYAYRNSCPGCSQPLESGRLAQPFLTCRACDAAFDVIHAGRAALPGAPAAEPFPLAYEDGRVRVAIPVGA
jgi:Fe-S cluster biogenesis protein NfuA/nitrite reductase/ring-hydroxylating ferredoxin subunit